MSRFGSTWSLMGSSWSILRQDKELLIFPLISGISCLAVMAGFAFPIVQTEAWRHIPGEESSLAETVGYYGVVFLYYLVNYTVIIFFNSAIIAGAIERMEGGDPTVASCLQAASSRLPQILGWALVSATVGLILRMIEDRSENVGKFFAGLLGLAWSVGTFLVVPILVVEKKGPIEAVKDSGRLLRKTWGEQLIGNFGFGMVFFVLSLPAVLLVLLGIASGQPTTAIPCIGLAVVYLLLLSLVQSALQTIFQAALYLHARDEGREIPGYDHHDLAGAYHHR